MYIHDCMYTQWNFFILGTALSVLISGIILYTVLCSWNHGWCPDCGRCPHFWGVDSYRGVPLLVYSACESSKIATHSGKEKLSKAVGDQKWDRVKLVCTQPYNKVHVHMYYNGKDSYWIINYWTSGSLGGEHIICFNLVLFYVYT